MSDRARVRRDEFRLFRDDRVFAVYGMAKPRVLAGLEGAHALPVRDVEFVLELPQAVVLHGVRLPDLALRRAVLTSILVRAQSLPFTGRGEPDDCGR